MARIKLDFVNEFVDRHGKMRRYFRRRGHKKVPLPGLPGSAEFMAAYQAALGMAAPRREIGESRTRAGTVSAAISSYYGSVAFFSLAPGSQRIRRSVLERFRAEHGDMRVALMQRPHVEKMVAAKAATPVAAQTFRKTLHYLMQHCVATGMISNDPTLGVRSVKIRSDGFHTWTESEIEAFEAKHPIGSRARLAFSLLLCTAQRSGDVRRMGRQHVRNGAITIRQEKTAAVVEIPILPELRVILDATPSDHLTYLTTAYDKPFTATGFANWFRDRCDEAGLPQCTAHGLRKAACRRLAEAGCSANEIASISGHASLREVERYTKAADQARMARNALARKRV
jgi:integrase